MPDRTFPVGLAKVAGRHRCKHPMRDYKGEQTGSLSSSWNKLLRDLKRFGETLQQPPRGREVVRRTV